MSSKKKITETVDRAIETNRSIKSLTLDLDACKEVLREEARERAEVGEDGRLLKVELQGELGVATVSFPKDSPRFVKGADANVLTEKLGKATWNSLFEAVTVVKMKSEFEAAFALLSASDKKSVEKLIEWVPGTPAVGLPK